LTFFLSALRGNLGTTPGSLDGDYHMDGHWHDQTLQPQVAFYK